MRDIVLFEPTQEILKNRKLEFILNPHFKMITRKIIIMKLNKLGIATR